MGSDFSSPQRKKTGSGAHQVTSYSMGIWSLRPLISAVQFLYLYIWKVFIECGQGGEGIRLPRLANTTVRLPLSSSFTTSSPHEFQDTRTGLYLVLRLRMYGVVPLLLLKYTWCGAEISTGKLHRMYCMNERLKPNHCCSTMFVTWMVCFSTGM